MQKKICLPTDKNEKESKTKTGKINPKGEFA